MANTPLWMLGACETAALIQSGGATAEASVGSAIDRMRAINGQYNAVVDDLGEVAMMEAVALDRRMRDEGPVGPLHGVPVTVKINVDQAGCSTSNGVVAYAATIANTDSPVVRNLRKAGAIIIGRTNTPEFSFRATTDNPLHGRTVNPWHEAASPGGSSGGAAVAVMSGMGALAHGNDLGGSLRYPAAATGAATIKPGLGRVPAYNPSATKERGLLAQLMSAQGIIAREARDLRLGLEALTRYDPHDPWMVPMGFGAAAPASGSRIKVAVARDGLGVGVSSSVDAALDAAANALRDRDFEIVEVEPPRVRECGDLGFRALMTESNALLKPDMERNGSHEINRIFANHLEVFPPFSGAQLLEVLAQRSAYVREWQLFLEDYPLVLTPFMLGPIHSWNRDAEDIAGASDVLGKGHYSFAINFLGLPAGIVAAGFEDGMPVGVQIVGRRFREDMIVSALETIEQKVGAAHQLLWSQIKAA